MEDNRMRVHIVPMNADHLDEVAELERICFSTPWSRNMLAEELDNACAAFLVDKGQGIVTAVVLADGSKVTDFSFLPFIT